MTKGMRREWKTLQREHKPYSNHLALYVTLSVHCISCMESNLHSSLRGDLFEYADFCQLATGDAGLVHIT